MLSGCAPAASDATPAPPTSNAPGRTWYRPNTVTPPADLSTWQGAIEALFEACKNLDGEALSKLWVSPPAGELKLRAWRSQLEAYRQDALVVEGASLIRHETPRLQAQTEREVTASVIFSVPELYAVTALKLPNLAGAPRGQESYNIRVLNHGTSWRVSGPSVAFVLTVVLEYLKPNRSGS